MNETRKFWLDTMLKIVDPVLNALSEGRLKHDMKIECDKPREAYEKWVYLETFGRTLVGMAPWLGCRELKGEEEALRKHYASLARKCLAVAVDPDSSDFFNFDPIPFKQTIVDAAFLAQAILRAPHELWEPLDEITKTRILDNMRLTRKVKPHRNNWLMFSAMIESLLHYANASDWDSMRIDYALLKHMDRYKGDGWYGDGENFHTDYYNSFVIQPMLLDVLYEVGDEYEDWNEMKPVVLKRASRYATILEHMISPEGTYPLVGRSLAYRFGAFHCLSMMAYNHTLEETLTPSMVRCALTAVIKRICSFEDMFSKDGWLTLGICGHQPDMAEKYLSTASMYLCTAVFLPLGLPCEDAFWSNPDEDWTMKALWSGKNLKCEHSLD